MTVEPGWEWVQPLLTFKTPRKFMTVRQARQAIGCVTSVVHDLINGNPPSLFAHRVSGKVDGRGHWRISAASVLQHIWSNTNNKVVVPAKAAFVMCHLLIHHLPYHALKLIKEALDERMASHEAAMKALGIKQVNEPATDELRNELRTKRATATPVVAPVQTTLL